VEYFTHPKCSRAVLVFALSSIPDDTTTAMVLNHLQRNKTSGYIQINKDMTVIPIDGISDTGGAITTFPVQCSGDWHRSDVLNILMIDFVADSRAWIFNKNFPFYNYDGVYSPILSLASITRLVCSLPIFHKFALLSRAIPSLPCYEWTFEEPTNIQIVDIIAHSLILDFVMSFEAKDFMSARMVQKMLLEHSDFARNKQVVATILLAIERVDKSISFFSSDKVWNIMKKCLMELLALDAEFKKECETECKNISKRLKQVQPLLNIVLEIKTM
jgi:hypothetical protein